MPEVNLKFIDPLTGLIRPASEYAPDSSRQQSANLEDARRAWFDSSGRLKTTAEIRADEATAKTAADRVAASLRAKTVKVLSVDELLIQNLSTLIDARAQATRYLSPQERLREAEYTDTLKHRRAEVEAKIVEEQRIATFQQSRQFQLVQEHAESFGRSPPPDSDPQAVALAIAIARSTEFTDPAEYARMYFQEAAKVEEAAYAAAINARERKRDELARLQVETATTSQTVLDTQHRMEQAKELASDG
jgi:hypothetical protein